MSYLTPVNLIVHSLPGAKKRPKEKVDPEEEKVSNEDAKEYIKNIIDYQRGQRDLVEDEKLFIQYKMDKDAKAFEGILIGHQLSML